MQLTSRVLWQRAVCAFFFSTLITPAYAQEADDEFDTTESMQIQGTGTDTAMGGEDGVFVMGAIGDSITTGFDAKTPLNNKSLSWSTGNNIFGFVNSHYRRAVKKFSGPVVKYNVAKVGSNSAGLAQQLTRLTDKLKGRELDYLTVMSGANDVCWWPRDHKSYLDRYQANMRQTIETAKKLNPNVKITLVPIPNMLLLYELGKAKGCSYRWRLFPMCDVLFFSQEESDRVAFGERLRDLNDTLHGLADEYSDNVYFAERVGTAKYVVEDISGIDCFHPSMTGQQKIAEDSWVGGWYDR